MAAVRIWLRLDLRRRWRSLSVLALLVAFTTTAVLTATAGARRGDSAIERLTARTLPLDLVVLPNEPGFDWDAVRAMPQVEAVSTFVVGGFALEETYSGHGDPIQNSGVFFASGDDNVARTVEAPVILGGRMFDPTRIDEAVVSPGFVEAYGYGIGDTVTAALPSAEQSDAYAGGSDATTSVEDLDGPRFPITIVGVVRSLWYSDSVGEPGLLLPSPAVYETYPDELLGASHANYINALVRLREGPAGIPDFQAALADLTGRKDIEVFNGPEETAAQERRDSFEADSLFAFALAALLAALFLVGQSVARYTAASLTEMRTLAAVGMTPRQSLQAAVASPILAALVGTSVGVSLAIVASGWFPIGSAANAEPDPGISPDWLVLGIGWVVIPLMVAAGAAGSALVARNAAKQRSTPRRSSIASTAARLGWPVPVIVGTRFALEPGRGRSAIPVRPAIIGSVVGVLGVIAAFTFANGVTDAASNPARFGQTYGTLGFLGFNDNDFGSADQLAPILDDEPAVTAVDDAYSDVAEVGGNRATLYSYDGAGGPLIDMVVAEGRPPESADEVVLGPAVTDALGVSVGDTVEVVGTTDTARLTLVGIGFTPEGPHNGYSNAGWLTMHGYQALFDGFKFHVLLVAFADGTDTDAAIARLNQATTDAGFGPVFEAAFTPQQVADIGQVKVLPVFLGGFLALLAVGAVGHALATAVRRRRHDIAVLRALGMTRWQSRGVVVVQASVLAVIGLVLGVPLGIALGRVLWQVVADYTPLQYVPPLAVLALALIAPAALIVANLLAAWPGRRAAGLRIGHVLRTE